MLPDCVHRQKRPKRWARTSASTIASLTNAKTVLCGLVARQDPSGCIAEPDRSAHNYGAVWYNRRPTTHKCGKQSWCAKGNLITRASGGTPGVQEEGAPVRSAEGRLRKRRRFREGQGHQRRFASHVAPYVWQCGVPSCRRGLLCPSGANCTSTRTQKLLQPRDLQLEHRRPRQPAWRHARPATAQLLVGGNGPRRTGVCTNVSLTITSC